VSLIAWGWVGATTGALIIVALFWWGLVRLLYWMINGQ
jgi:hypothetical protein